jgi:hypothetical protein
MRLLRTGDHDLVALGGGVEECSPGCVVDAFRNETSEVCTEQVPERGIVVDSNGFMNAMPAALVREGLRAQAIAAK